MLGKINGSDKDRWSEDTNYDQKNPGILFTNRIIPVLRIFPMSGKQTDLAKIWLRTLIGIRWTRGFCSQTGIIPVLRIFPMSGKQTDLAKIGLRTLIRIRRSRILFTNRNHPSVENIPYVGETNGFGKDRSEDTNWDTPTPLDKAWKCTILLPFFVQTSINIALKCTI